MRVQSLCYYPIKGCRGINAARMEVVRAGPQFDRLWMVVDEAGKFVTQRTDPTLATVVVRVDDVHLEVCSAVMPRELLVREALVMEGAGKPVGVWEDESWGYDMGETAATWFSRLLGRSVRLVRKSRRLRLSKGARARGDTVLTRFSDGYPILMTSMESLAWLNDRLAEGGAQPVGMERFRPNIVIEGVEGAFDEDTFGRMGVGGVDLLGVSRCTRCPVTCTDQVSGERRQDDEPRATLRRLRAFGRDKGCFGLNVDHLCQGTIRVGDELIVRERIDR